MSTALPFSGYIGRPVRLRFVGDTRKVSAFHYEQAKSLECERDGMFSDNNQKTVIASTREEVVAMLRAEVGRMLKTHVRLSSAPYDATHWVFEPYLGEVKGGLFWPVPSIVGATINPL